MRIVFHTAVPPALRPHWDRSIMLGFAYLAAYLRRARPSLEIHVAEDEAAIAALRPDVLGISCVTDTYPHARVVAREARERLGAVTIVGGPHVTALPDWVDPEFDYAVLGEGEQTLLELIDQLAAARPAPEPEAIDGLVHWRQGTRIVNRTRALIEPLDELPTPDRHVYGAERLRRGSVAMMTSRGCPYDCGFCATTTHWHKLRMHSAEYVIEELLAVAGEFRPWRVVFDDDLFIADRRRCARICEAILSNGLHRRLQFHVSGRANLLTDEVCAMLREINTRSVFIGVESANARVLKNLAKCNITPETNQRALDNLARHGITAAASFIIATPGETIDEAFESFTFIKANLDKISKMDAGPLRLLPGTRFWADVMREHGPVDGLPGLIHAERDTNDGWWRLREHYPSLAPAMTRGELRAVYAAFQELSACIEERNSGPRNIDTMGMRRIAAELGRRLVGRLGLRGA